MSKLKYNGTQSIFKKISLVHPNIGNQTDLVDKPVEANAKNISLTKDLNHISMFWKQKNLIKKNEINPKLSYPDIKSELEKYNSGENVMTELPIVSETKYPLLSKHFRTLQERQIEESFKLIKTFHILNDHYLTNNIRYIAYNDFLNHSNVIYHGYHNKQAHNELRMLESYGKDIEMHLINPSSTIRIFEVLQQVVVTNQFQNKYSFFPKLSPDAGDLIVKDKFVKSYGVGELKSGSLSENNIIKLFTKMGPKYSHLTHMHVFIDGDKDFIEETLQDAKVEIPKNFELHFINTEEVFSDLYEIQHPTDIQFDLYYTQYMEIYEYIEHQKLLGNGKKPHKIFLDKIAKESNSLDSNQNIDLFKFYSHFLSRYDLKWVDTMSNVVNNSSSKLVSTDLDDVSDIN